MQRDLTHESENYREREFNNYLQLDYPLLPKLYGIYENEDIF